MSKQYRAQSNLQVQKCSLTLTKYVKMRQRQKMYMFTQNKFVKRQF